MSRSRWRALRALRVILACLALWLPARVASAAVGPTDAVVMIAGAGSGVEVSPVAAGQERSRSHANAATVAHTRTAALDDGANSGTRKTSHPGTFLPIYLLHCALLR
jgi:hypothetical protein